MADTTRLPLLAPAKTVCADMDNGTPSILPFTVPQALISPRLYGLLKKSSVKDIPPIHTPPHGQVPRHPMMHAIEHGIEFGLMDRTKRDALPETHHADQATDLGVLSTHHL